MAPVVGAVKELYLGITSGQIAAVGTTSLVILPRVVLIPAIAVFVA